MISLLHPSRGRPEKSFLNAKEWIEKAGCEVELILSLDKSDGANQLYAPSYLGFANHILIEDNDSVVQATNKAAAISKGDILVFMSDDFVCPDNWALKIIQQTQDKTDWIAKTWDGIQKWIITMPIMDRTYYNRFGYIYYPEYLHMFCDTELTCVADLTGRKINLDIPFTHNHYSTGKSVKDEVSIRADATWDQGEKLFVERAKRNFDLINPPGKITSQEYINWMKMKGVR